MLSSLQCSRAFSSLYTLSKVYQPAVDVIRRLLNVLFSSSPRDGASLKFLRKTKQRGSFHAFYTSNLNKNHRKCKSLNPQIQKYNNRINKPVLELNFLIMSNGGNPKSKSLSSSCPSTTDRS